MIEGLTIEDTNLEMKSKRRIVLKFGTRLRPRRCAKVVPRPTNEKKTQQGEPVRVRGSREPQYSPLIGEQARSAGRKTRSICGQQ
ncbi:hypothetical protein TNCV_2308671 [Trichonephila clavipes]|nr:hypothetical protein TNCV_2308671 [Trichonephila clavipes]